MKTRKLKSAGPSAKRKHSQEANTPTKTQRRKQIIEPSQVEIHESSQEAKPLTRAQRRKQIIEPSQVEIHESTQESKPLSRAERRKQLTRTESKKHISEPSPVVTREPSPTVAIREPSPVVTRERPRPPYQNTQRYINCLQNDLSKIWEENERFKSINNIDIFFSELEHNDNKESYVNFFIFQALNRKDYSADKIKNIFNTRYSSNIVFIREKITHDYYNIKYNLNIGRITLYISIHGYTKNKTIILHFNDNEKQLDYDSDFMYNLLSEYQEALCEIEQIGLSHGVDREIIHNFDYYHHIMKTFDELLNRCIEQKKHEIDDDKYFDIFCKLKANDAESGRVQNILNIFYKKYETSKIVIINNIKNYSQIVLEYQNVYIGILVVNNTFITFGCNLTKEKILLSMYYFWVYNGNEKKYLNSSTASSSSDKDKITTETIIQNEGDTLPFFDPTVKKENRVLHPTDKVIFPKPLNETIFENFKDLEISYQLKEKLSPFTYIPKLKDFFTKLNRCIIPVKPKNCNFITYILITEDNDTFSAFNIYKLFKKYYPGINVIIIATLPSRKDYYYIIFKYKKLYIYIQGKNKYIILRFNIDFSLLKDEKNEDYYELVNVIKNTDSYLKWEQEKIEMEERKRGIFRGIFRTI